MTTKTEFKKSEYLYGVSGKYFKQMSYEDAIKEKIRLGKELKQHLTNQIFDLGKYEHNARLTAVIKAIEFNETLLKEMDDKI